MTAGVVIKVGGSLYDLPDLGERLRRWLAERLHDRPLLVPGGGDTANAVRAFHKVHGLSEEACHWLALRALALNAHFLAEVVGGAAVVGGDHTDIPWSDRINILDPHTFARADECRDGRLPHCWAATSDSLAVRAATVFGAGRLVLLKSVTVPPDLSWPEAARRGYVDPAFPDVVRAARGLDVEVVNFRGFP